MLLIIFGHHIAFRPEFLFAVHRGVREEGGGIVCEALKRKKREFLRYPHLLRGFRRCYNEAAGNNK